jgi:anti-sigma factor RsiW
MNCRDIEQLLPYYAADELGAEERLAVERHLEKCRACSRSLDEYLILENSLRSLDNNIPSHREVADSVLKKIDLAESPRYSNLFLRPPVLAFTAALVLMVITFLENKAILEFFTRAVYLTAAQINRLSGWVSSLSVNISLDGFWLLLAGCSLSGFLILALAGRYALTRARI